MLFIGAGIRRRAVIPLNICYPLLSPRAAIPHILPHGPYFCALVHAHPAAASRSAVLARVQTLRPREAANMRPVKRSRKGRRMRGVVEHAIFTL